MNWPQITWIALVAAGVAVSAVKHGESRGPHSVWQSIWGAAIGAGLLYAGGFFD